MANINLKALIKESALGNLPSSKLFKYNKKTGKYDAPGTVTEGKYNSNRNADDIFFLWDASIDDDRQGIEHGNASSGGRRYSDFQFNTNARGFDKFKKDVEKLAKKNKWEYDLDNESLYIYESVNESKFKKGQTVKYIVPGTSDKMKTGKITGFESTRDEDFAVIDGKTISFSHISESVNEGSILVWDEMEKPFEDLKSALDKVSKENTDPKWSKALLSIWNQIEKAETNLNNYDRKLGVITTQE